MALECCHRFNQVYQPNDVTQALAATSLADNPEKTWFPNKGATSHMTSNPGQKNRSRDCFKK